jgi:hypothetical protein
MKHHKRVVKKKPKFFDVESGSGTFTVGGGLQDATDEYVDYGDIHDPYSPYHPDDVIPSPSPSPDPNHVLILHPIQIPILITIIIKMIMMIMDITMYHHQV